MAYATRQDFLTQLKDEETAGLMSPDSADPVAQADDVDLWLEKASSEIDQYIGSRYARAIAMACPYLVYACVAIARKQCDLFLEREKVIRDYDDVILALKAVRDRKSDLIGADGPLPERSGAEGTAPMMAIDCL